MEEKHVNLAGYIGYFASIALAIVGLPLALKMIEQNSMYGVRIQSTLENVETWYAVNSVAGWTLFWSGLASIGLVYVIKNFLQRNLMVTFFLAMLVPVVFPVTAMIISIISVT